MLNPIGKNVKSILFGAFFVTIKHNILIVVLRIQCP